MEETKHGPVASAAANSSNTFSRASMIGMFIKLQVCQLTQPYESLLFENGGGSFWRVNPISSFAEACIVFFYLGQVFVRSSRLGRDQLLLRLQQAAGALLLVRSTNADEDGGVLLDSLLGDIVSNGQVIGLSEPGTADGDVDLEPEEADIADNTLSSMSTGAMGSSVDRHLSLDPGDRLTGDLPAPQPGSASIIAPKINAAFGGNALARKDLRIDIATMFAEVCLVVKLLAVTGNAWFSAAGMLLALGWVAVQSLLLLFHSREMKEADLEATLRFAGKLKQTISDNDRRWDAFFLTWHLPVFGYLCYLATFSPWISPEATGLLAFLKNCWWFVTYILAMELALSSLFAIFYLASVYYDRIFTRGLSWRRSLDLITWILVCWFAAASFSHWQQTCGPEPSHSCMGDFQGFFSPDRSMHQLVDQRFPVFGKSMMLLLVLVPLATVYVMFTIPRGLEWDLVDLWFSNSEILDTFKKRIPGYWMARLNAALVLIVLAVYVARHDESHSHEPGWTDVFG